MKRFVQAALAAFIPAIAFLVAGAPAAEAQRVAVCHKPGAKQKIVRVEPRDVAMHEAHGDTLVLAEVCNDLDDDCDRAVDEGIAPVATSCGAGECAGNVGEETCVGGVLVDSCDPEAGASAELCNGFDDDCDGATDDDPTDLLACTAGLGECQADGVEICSLGTRVCDATPGARPEAFESTCDDTFDNDCDGTSDSSDPSCVACPGWTLAQLNGITTPASPADCSGAPDCSSTGVSLSCIHSSGRDFLIQATSAGRILCDDEAFGPEECSTNLSDQPALSAQSCAEILLRSDLWATFCGD
ncbi:MAG: MopE-related protein [Myxococcota bacterium]